MTKISGREEKISYFPTGGVGERKEGRKKRIQGFLLRSSEIRRSKFVGQIVKVYLLVEGYAYVPKSRDFTKTPKEEIWGKSNAWAWEVFLRLPTHSSTLQELRILPTLVYFHPNGLILEEILCRGPKGLFGLTRNCLKPFLWTV